MLNSRDQQEFSKVSKRPQNENFRIQFNLLMSLRFQLHSMAMVTAATPMAHEIKAGKPGIIVGVTQPGQDPQSVIEQVATVSREINMIAHNLSTYFPEVRRYHWQEVFKAIGHGGTGDVSQRQQGGRPTDPLLDEYFEKWRASNFDSKEKKKLRDHYVASNPNDDGAYDRFNDTMKRRKRSLKG